MVSIAHADDDTFFLNSAAEFAVLHKHTEQYARVSGAAINEAKSVAYRMPRGSCAATMAVTSLREGDEQRGEAEKQVERVQILGVWFGFADRAWHHNWWLCKDTTRFQLTRWHKWRLSLYQHAMYVNIYCLPMATLLAAIYPPLQVLIEEVGAEVFHVLWGTAHFPLAQVEACRARGEGSLGLRVLGPWLADTYAVANFAG